VNNEAQKHLDKAGKLIAKGDGFYAQAADEIIAAQKADPTLSYKEIGTSFDKGATWVRSLVTWRTTEQAASPTPFARAEGDTVRKDREAAKRIAKTDPGIVAEMFAAMDPEKREMVISDIATTREFTDAVRANPVTRDEVALAALGTGAEQKERHEEAGRKRLAAVPSTGWSDISSYFGNANRELTYALDVLVKLSINAQVDPKDDPLRVALGRAEMIGRTIHEVEMAWGITPISDKIEELRAATQS